MSSKIASLISNLCTGCLEKAVIPKLIKSGDILSWTTLLFTLCSPLVHTFVNIPAQSSNRGLLMLSIVFKDVGHDN
jgi:hypothetical protein